MQLPSEVAPSATVQKSHAPLHALLQHTLSAQLPLVHSPAAAQATPLAFLGLQAEKLSQ